MDLILGRIIQVLAACRMGHLSRSEASDRPIFPGPQVSEPDPSLRPAGQALRSLKSLAPLASRAGEWQRESNR